MEDINRRINEYEGRLRNAELIQDDAKIDKYLSIIDKLQQERNILLSQGNLYKLLTTINHFIYLMLYIFIYLYFLYFFVFIINSC